MKKLIMLGLVLALIGCATQPMPSIDAELASIYLNEAPGSGKVTVTRDKGFVGSAAKAYVYIDAKPIIGLRAGQKIELWLSAGEHMLATMCRTDGSITEAKVNVVAGKSQTYRISYSLYGGWRLAPTAFN